MMIGAFRDPRTNKNGDFFGKYLLKKACQFQI